MNERPVYHGVILDEPPKNNSKCDCSDCGFCGMELCVHRELIDENNELKKRIQELEYEVSCLKELNDDLYDENFDLKYELEGIMR